MASVSKSPRANDFDDDLPVSPRAASSFDLTPVRQIVETATTQASVASVVKEEVRSVVSPASVASPAPVAAVPSTPLVSRAPSSTSVAPWDLFGLPKMDVRIRPVPSISVLLEGPTKPVAIFLPKRLRDAAAVVRAQARGRGERLSYRTFYAHALAYAYQHHRLWIDQVPMDGRRREAGTSLTTSEGRTTMAMTPALEEATQSLLLEASSKNFDSAPAGENLKTTAIAWAMSQMGEWLPGAIANPVSMGD